MSYKSLKNQALQKWQKKEVKFNGIPKKIKVNGPEFYEKEKMKSLIRKLLTFFNKDSKKFEIENLAVYCYKNKHRFKNKFNLVRRQDDQSIIYSTILGHGYGFYQFVDHTGYQLIWDLKEVNYTKLTQKMLNISEKNKVMYIEGLRWLVWVPM